MDYKTLPVDLNEEELKQKGDVLATQIEQRVSVRDQRKQTNAAFKEQLEQIDGSIASLARQLRTRKEERVVGCMWERDDSRMSMLLVRQDTGEVVETRAMRDDERQPSLFPEATEAPPRFPRRWRPVSSWWRLRRDQRRSLTCQSRSRGSSARRHSCVSSTPRCASAFGSQSMKRSA